MSYVRVLYQGAPWDDGALWGTGGDLEQERRGDIRIAMRDIDGSSGGILAYNFFPTNGDMLIDRLGSWASPTNDYRFLRNVVMHEHGHGLGLYHVCSTNTGQLLEPYINTSFDGPQHDDLRAGQRQYGDPFEVDDSPGEATYLGTVSMDTPLRAGEVPGPAIPHGALLSIDANDEEDWFKFKVDNLGQINIELNSQNNVCADQLRLWAANCETEEGGPTEPPFVITYNVASGSKKGWYAVLVKRSQGCTETVPYTLTVSYP